MKVNKKELKAIVIGLASGLMLMSLWGVMNDFNVDGQRGLSATEVDAFISYLKSLDTDGDGRLEAYDMEHDGQDKITDTEWDLLERLSKAYAIEVPYDEGLFTTIPKDHPTNDLAYHLVVYDPTGTTYRFNLEDVLYQRLEDDGVVTANEVSPGAL